MEIKEVIEKVNQVREEGKIVGLVQGSWDMFHLGHLRYLKEARKLCDFLIVGMDDDEKIRYRKGIKRPIIPLEERYQMIEELEIADVIVEKRLNEAHWELIKKVTPDVLVAIKENYNDDQIEKLKEYCGNVAILPRQATTSTSDIVRRTLIKNGVKLPNKNNPKVAEAVDELKIRIGYNEQVEEPIKGLIENLYKSTDWISPVAACCKYKNKWYYGVNQIDQSIPVKDIETRSELFYDTVEHAEINLLKQLEAIDYLDSPVYTTLFPCDKCMKVLIDKGVKEIYYIEDHPERNWSKRSHEKAMENGVKTTKIILNSTLITTNEVNNPSNIIAELYDSNYDYRFIEPRNAKYIKQLEIMLQQEKDGKDPLDPSIIDQEILFTTNHWYISYNRFPNDNIEHQFLVASLQPIYSIDDMPKEMWEELRDIWQRLIAEYNIPGGALCYRFGDLVVSGASLKRVHVHLVVPKKDKKVKFTIGGNATLRLQKLKSEEKSSPNN